MCLSARSTQGSGCSYSLPSSRHSPTHHRSPHLAVPSQLLQALGLDAVGNGLGRQEVWGQAGKRWLAVSGGRRQWRQRQQQEREPGGLRLWRLLVDPYMLSTPRPAAAAPRRRSAAVPPQRSPFLPMVYCCR